MVTCKKCSQIFSDEYQFCPNCGTAVNGHQLPKDNLDDVTSHRSEKTSEKPKVNKKVWIGLSIGAVLVAITGIMFISHDKADPQPPKTKTETKSEPGVNVSRVADGKITRYVYKERARGGVNRSRYVLTDKTFKEVAKVTADNLSSQNSKGNMLVANETSQYMIDDNGEKIGKEYSGLLQSWGRVHPLHHGDDWWDYQSTSGALTFTKHKEGVDPNKISDNAEETIDSSGIVDANGKVVIESKDYFYDQFRNGMAVTVFATRKNFDNEYSSEGEGPKYGVIDERGKVILEAKYSEAHIISDDYFLVATEDDQFAETIIDRKGNIVKKDIGMETLEEIGRSLSPELLAYEDANSSYEQGFGVLDQDMKPLIKPRFKVAPAINAKGNILGIEYRDSKLSAVLYNKKGKEVNVISDSKFLDNAGEEDSITLTPTSKGFMFEIRVNEEDEDEKQVGFISNKGEVTYETDLGPDGHVTLFANLDYFEKISIPEDGEDLTQEIKDFSGKDVLKNRFWTSSSEESKNVTTLEDISTGTVVNRFGKKIVKNAKSIHPAGEHMIVQYKLSELQILDKDTGKVVKKGKIKD